MGLLGREAGSSVGDDAQQQRSIAAAAALHAASFHLLPRSLQTPIPPIFT